MPTSEWSIETPTSLEFDDVTGLRVRLIAGSVAVLATTGSFDILGGQVWTVLLLDEPGGGFTAVPLQDR